MDGVPEPAPERLRIEVRGCVQGVGFRPHVLRLAERYGLSGFARNDPAGVQIEVQGRAARRFAIELRDHPPPLARVTGLTVTALDLRDQEPGFTIDRSQAGAATNAIVPPDVAVCEACLEEMCSPGARRWRYPFITCTQCGPRYTITRALPYDRPQTSMASFALCPDCTREYQDPLDRRCHAQPLGCPRCGPSLATPIEEVLAAIGAGEIVAIKGLGGFHLVCNARDEGAVGRLRAAKDRRGKPFAVMVANLASAALLAAIDENEGAALAAPERPIVLLDARAHALAPSVAPGLATIGLMLPSTPIQYLLFHEAAGRPAGIGWLEAPQPLALVMTSANPAGEPLVIDGAEARAKLAGIADRVVDHDRPIVARADDSIMRRVAGSMRLIRRARGFVPVPVTLARPHLAILALGGSQKVAPCLIRGEEAWLGPHIGTLDDAATIAFFEETVAHLRRLLATEPVAVAHDAHPDFASTRIAEAFGLPTVAVQHHHAHAAAVLAEHGRDDPALALVFDGYGVGADGGAWGGELLRVDGARMGRLGHLRPLPLPGGDRAARSPWRMAAGVLAAIGRAEEIARRFADHGEAEAVGRLALAPRTPRTSSCGRLFDAVAGLLGVAEDSGYEARPAMLLEQLVVRPRILGAGWRVAADLTLDLTSLLEVLAGIGDPRAGAELFHGTLAAAAIDWVAQAAAATGIGTVVLSGGCFVNRPLTEAIVAGLVARGLEPLLAKQVPCNDGGLALGQAVIAARIIEEGQTCVSPCPPAF